MTRAARCLTVALILSAGLAIGSCGGSGAQSVQPGNGSVVSRYGLRATVPPGWVGLAIRPSPKAAATLEAATVPLPADGHQIDDSQLGSGNCYVIINDLGKAVPSWRAHRLTVRRSDVGGPYEGNFPSGALLTVDVGHRAMQIRVRFGSHPTASQLRQVNKLLESLGVEGGRQGGS